MSGSSVCVASYTHHIGTRTVYTYIYIHIDIFMLRSLSLEQTHLIGVFSEKKNAALSIKPAGQSPIFAMPLLPWIWKEAKQAVTSKYVFGQEIHMVEGWSSLGPTGQDRMDDMWFRGEVGSSCFITISPMRAIKVKLVIRQPFGMLFCRTAGGPMVYVRKEHRAVEPQVPLLVNVTLNPDRQTENYLRPSFETFSGRGILKEEPVPKEWTWHELALYVARAARDLGEPFSKLDPFYVRLIIDQKIIYQSNYTRTLLAALVDDDITLAIQQGLLPRDWAEEQGHDHAPAQSHGDASQTEPKAKAKAKARGVAKTIMKRPGTGRAA